MIKYARFLAQKNEDALEVPIGRNKMEKVTLIAIRDILKLKVTYEVEDFVDEQE